MRLSWIWLLLAVGLALIFRFLIGEVYDVSSSNMLPTLYQHDSVFILKAAKIQRGDVVVFRSPLDSRQVFAARVIGISGDKIWIEEGELMLNKRPVEKHIPTDLKYQADWLTAKDFPGDGNGPEDYVHWQENLMGKEHGILLKKEASLEQMPPMVIPEDKVFLIGDNRFGSEDSRHWPEDKRFVAQSEILGRVERVLWSCGEKLSLVPFFCDPRTMRWGRSFLKID